MTSSKIATLIVLTSLLISGCKISPFSPSSSPRIKNSGEIGEIKSNQNGIMAEIGTLKNRMDVMARDIENIQNGIFNSSNKNFGVQIFQGDGGLAVGISLLGLLAVIAINYKIKADKYKKTAEIFGEQIKMLNNEEIENNVLMAALAKKVEADAYKILKK